MNSSFEIQDKVYVPHVFSSVGFLDDCWWERSYWTYGVHFYSGARGHGYSKTLNPSGDILVFDEEAVFGYLSHGGSGIFSVRKTSPTVDLKKVLENEKHIKQMEEAKEDGSELARMELPFTPVFDGMIASDGKIYLSLKDGSVLCLGGE